MEPYAVVETGGKQYRVEAGDTLKVELLEGEAGTAVVLDAVLALSDGKSLTIGAPFVKGAKINAEIVEQARAPKVVAYKKKRRKGYERKVGHRQHLTVLRVAGIG
jgi:large subunit ribosomal protein L21